MVDADDNEEMNIKMLRMSVPGEPGVVSNHLIVFQSSKQPNCHNTRLKQRTRKTNDLLQDYPILATVPKTSFSCVGKAEGGYYADVETGCQVDF